MSSISVFDDFADDFLAERVPRSMIIVGSSKVDTLLSEVLAAYLLPKRAKPKDQDELLEGDRPLGTFSSRIKMTYRLGLIDESLYLVLETLRSIRNDSAHSVAFDAGQSPLRERVSELRKQVAPRLSYEWTRDRYFAKPSLNKPEELQCLLLTICVLLEGIRTKTTQTRGRQATVGISKR